MSSRSEKDLHPQVAKRWSLAKQQYAVKYPDAPQPFLTQTYRSPEEQAELYAQGRTKPGKVVTNAKGGQSIHNYKPGCAFDIAFKTGKKVFWELTHYKKFAAIAKKLGLEWGGDWKSFQDNPHFQAPHYSWRKAKAGQEPLFEVEV